MGPHGMASGSAAWYISGTMIRPGVAMRLRARWAAALIAVTAATALAGCGGGSPVHLTGTSPPPGHEAPANAVAGWAQHLLAGGDPVIACGYVDPDEEGNCLGTVSTISQGGTGTWRVGHSVESGNEAVVAVELDNVCFSSCTTTVDPDNGLPRHGVSFGLAFERTQDPVKTKGDYALGCIRMDGRWYVELAITGII